jgi:hypothetical protein
MRRGGQETREGRLRYYALSRCRLVVGKLVRCEYPPHRGTRVRTPQTAATPSPKANANPTRRPDGVLLLQPWSTALIQTRKSRMAKIARALSHIDNSLPNCQKRFLRGKGRSSQVRVSYGLLARCGGCKRKRQRVA